MRSMQLEHFMKDGQEIVVVDGHTKYLLDRQRQELRRLDRPAIVLRLEQRQVGCTPDGGQEVLERYCSAEGESVVVDASPDWLCEIGANISSPSATTRD